jgi:hypothetical protein
MVLGSASIFFPARLSWGRAPALAKDGQKKETNSILAFAIVVAVALHPRCVCHCCSRCRFRGPVFWGQNTRTRDPLLAYRRGPHAKGQAGAHIRTVASSRYVTHTQNRVIHSGAQIARALVNLFVFLETSPRVSTGCNSFALRLPPVVRRWTPSPTNLWP